MPDNLNYFVELTKGKVGNNIPVNKFGRNPDIDTGPAEIWPVPNLIWIPPTVAQIHSVQSLSGNDSEFGTGTRKVVVIGLLEDFTEAFEELVMDGTNPVLTTKLYIRINMLMQSDAGVLENNDDDITITSQIDGTIQDRIPAGAGKGASTRFSIPAGKEGVPKKIIISLNRSSGTGNARSKILLLSRININGTPLMFELANFDTNINATQPVIVPIDIGEPLPPMSDIFIRVEEVTESNTDISGSFQMILSKKS